jgi:hypothetical protein
MWDVREKLVMIPPKFEVHVRKYKKYACQNQPQCGIAAAERPTGLVEGDKYDTSVGTQIIRYKYAYFLTLYPADHKRWLDWYWLLYDLESEAKEQALTGAALVAFRHAREQPVWDLMRQELDSIETRTEQVVLPKSELRQALNYMRNHWQELTRYLDDAQLPLDNNECEQLMREISIGRKNWLFVGSLAGGERNAGFLGLVSSAHRNNIDVWAYVNDVLRRLLAGETNYEPLLPWNWAQQYPESIRTYRQQERSDRDIRQRDKRAKRRANQKRQARLDRR